MQKKYAVLRVDEWRKRAFSESTDNYLKTDGFHSTDGISTGLNETTMTKIVVSTKDEQAFEKDKYYLMTIEELPDLPEPTSGDFHGRRYGRLIDDRRAQDCGMTPVKPGRKFRDE